MPGRDRAQDQSISTARIAELLTITFGYARRSPEFEYHREALVEAIPRLRGGRVGGRARACDRRERGVRQA